ncbi:MAG: hydroxymethylglutaryl-CoA reductase, degradative [Myxococcales bacterium]|nr:hydroxymethylglutaryl-CoA reductase, degradative [Myxococcales bacterium]
MSAEAEGRDPGERQRRSRIAGFYRLDRAARLSALVEAGFLSGDQAAALAATGSALPFETADQLIENVVGCFELPIGIGLNFVVNGRDYVVPMVVEEPSIVAAVSHAACIVRGAGGFSAEADAPVMTGQVQVVGVEDVTKARAALFEAAPRLVAAANAAEPGMARRGGGATGIDVRVLEGTSRYSQMLVVHLHVDARDAMGANLVNTMCEAIAPLVEELTGGRVYLRILTNLTDRRRVRARCSIPTDALAWQGFSGAEVAEGVAQASAFAEADPYRAATHNKGVMNGIDAAAVAVGQDWRAIEAGAHAYAARDGVYGPMATWRVDGGHLVGEIDIPMALGIVGGPTRVHPTVQVLLSMLGVESAAELACVFASVGLAQNLAALKALASTGIQRGHMALHARSVAATAGATGAVAERIAARLIEEGRIKVDRARELLAELSG